jgi:endonuclease YncB( thermonuclease family)
VKEFVWRNPHSFVRIEVTTKEGTTELWNLEWGSTTQLQAAKYPVTRTTIKPGDHIVAGGEPGRDPAARRVRIYSIKRPIDGWEWEGTVD